METNGAVTRTYRSVQWAVVPGSLVRGALLGLLYVPLSLLFFVYVAVAFGGAAAYPFLGIPYRTVGPAGIAVAGFAGPVLLTFGLTYLGYRRKRYELGPEGITESHWLPLASDRFVPYDAIESVTLTQTRAQALYGAGTIVISDRRRGDSVPPRRFRYVETPEAVYTNVLRNVADVSGETPEDLEPPEVGEAPAASAELSRLSGDRLAADTGFQHLLPLSILHPDPRAAAAYGLRRSAYHVPIWLLVLLPAVPLALARLPVDATALNDSAPSAISGVPIDAAALAVVGLWIVAYVALVGGWYYWRYDRKQYELYADHLRLLDGDTSVTANLGDVRGVEARDGRARSEAVGAVAVLDASGSDLLVFEFVREPESVAESLREWIASATTEATTDAPAKATTDAPAEATTDAPAEATTDDPAEATTDATDDPTGAAEEVDVT